MESYRVMQIRVAVLGLRRACGEHGGDGDHCIACSRGRMRYRGSACDPMFGAKEEFE